MRHVSKLPSVQLQRRLRIVLSQPLRSELWRIAWRRVTSVLPPSGFERCWMLRINQRPRPARRRHTVRVDHVRVPGASAGGAGVAGGASGLIHRVGRSNSDIAVFRVSVESYAPMRMQQHAMSYELFAQRQLFGMQTMTDIYREFCADQQARQQSFRGPAH